MTGLKLHATTSRREEILSKKLVIAKAGGVYNGKKGKSIGSTLTKGIRN